MREDKPPVEEKKLSLIEQMQAAVALLTDSATNRVDEHTQAMRWAHCLQCTKRLQAFSVLHLAQKDKCSLCGCFLCWKIPTHTDPVETRKQGKEVLTACTAGHW